MESSPLSLHVTDVVKFVWGSSGRLGNPDWCYEVNTKHPECRNSLWLYVSANKILTCMIKLDLGSIFGLCHCRIEGVFLLRVVAGLENCTELLLWRFLFSFILGVIWHIRKFYFCCNWGHRIAELKSCFLIRSSPEIRGFPNTIWAN